MEKEVTMGFLDEIVGNLSDLLGGEGGEKSGLMDGVMNMLGSNESGGLNGLVQSFQEKGLGGIISSWIGTGENQPISADQIQQVLGSEAIQNIAAKAGISTEEISGKLAEFLPGVIDKLTPDGAVPEGGLLEKGLELIKGKLS
jgi:uncharacterized protein YidB (DUF937 family)